MTLAGYFLIVIGVNAAGPFAAPVVQFGDYQSCIERRDALREKAAHSVRPISIVCEPDFH